MKRILIYVWDTFNIEDIIHGFEDLGFYCDIIDNRGKVERNAKYGEMLSDFLQSHDHYDFVFSTNYYDYLANACKYNDTAYLAWNYDSPWDMGDNKSLKYDTTHVYTFDSDEAKRYIEDGYSNVHYLPLAVNTSRYDLITCSNEDYKKYSADGAFVGQLYADRLGGYLNSLPDYKKGFFNGIIDYNVGNYDSYAVEGVFSRDLTEWLNEPDFLNSVFEGESKTKTPIRSKGQSDIISRVNYLTNVAITNKERLILVSILSKYWNFKLYSGDTHETINQVICCGPVNYWTEMPKVFKCSKINLNVTVKCIKSGIPLRCLDIMGCGGFLLSNYQRDFEEYFIDGDNIALFSSLDEAYEKFKYYMEHETQRQKIAYKGYLTVKENYNYKVLLTKAIKMAGLDI